MKRYNLSHDDDRQDVRTLRAVSHSVRPLPLTQILVRNHGGTLGDPSHVGGLRRMFRRRLLAHGHLDRGRDEHLVGAAEPHFGALRRRRPATGVVRGLLHHQRGCGPRFNHRDLGGMALGLCWDRRVCAIRARFQSDAGAMRVNFIGASLAWAGHNLVVGSPFALACDLFTLAGPMLALNASQPISQWDRSLTSPRSHKRKPAPCPWGTQHGFVRVRERTAR